MKFIYDDGGRAAAGFKGNTGDCVTRSIAIATGLPYREVYDLVNAVAKESPKHKLLVRRGKPRYQSRSSARNGVLKTDIRKVMQRLGWRWVPTMQIGSGCKVHLCADELPKGRLIVSVSKHLTAVIDGVIHDTHDPQREIAVFTPDNGRELKPGEKRNVNGIYTIQRRCVYGYYVQEAF